MILPRALHLLCRWSYPENMAFVREEFGRMSFPRKSMKDRCEAASQTYQRFKDMLPVAGITEKTKPGTQ